VTWLRVATWNERGDRYGVPLAKFVHDMHHVLAACDIVGGQEIAGMPGRMTALGNAAGWAHAKPGPAPVIAWRRDRFHLVQARSELVARGRHVLPVPGRRSFLPDYHAAVVQLRDMNTDRIVTIINGHSPAHAEIRGHARPGGRARMHTEWCRNMADLFDEYQHHGRVFVTADWNWAYHHGPSKTDRDPKVIMHEVGAVSCWSGDRTIHGTLGSRCVDGIYSQHRGQTVDTIQTASDHRVVVVTYAV
jgi:hypothetical protein